MTPLRQQGLTLIEVMIALAVFSFGLLALAALMASGLKYNTSALHRSYASSQAYDMAARMRANRLGVIDGYYDSLSDSSDDDPNCPELGSDSVINCPSNSSEDGDPACGGFGSDSVDECSPTQMAQYDFSCWNKANKRLLPKGKGTVCLKSDKPESHDVGIYTITVTWNDDRDPSSERVSFIFEFQP